MTANEILSHFSLAQGTASKADIQAAYRAADEGGTIQADDALKLFGRARPEWHTAMRIETALQRLGCVEA